MGGRAGGLRAGAIGFAEWGNPKQQAAYDYLLGDSPYDNVTSRPYPSILVQTGRSRGDRQAASAITCRVSVSL